MDVTLVFLHVFEEEEGGSYWGEGIPLELIEVKKEALTKDLVRSFVEAKAAELVRLKAQQGEALLLEERFSMTSMPYYGSEVIKGTVSYRSPDGRTRYIEEYLFKEF